VRDPKRFKLNQYVQLVKTEVPICLYAILDPDQPVRVPNLNYFRWAPGTYRPKNWNNTGNFIWQQVEVNRYSIGYTVDYQAVDAARGWNPKAFFNASILTQAMCLMTQRFVNLMTTAANWTSVTGGPQTADANVLNGGAGTWDQASDDPSSPHFLAIKKALNEAVKRIMLATNGMVQRRDLKLVLGPDLAYAMADTSEIHHYLSQQANSLKVLKGEEPDVTTDYGLPQPLYGLDVVVEDSPIVTEMPNSSGTPATTNRQFIYPYNMANLVTRVGGIEGNYGSPSATTLQRYYYKYDMAVETFDRPRHKLFETYVVDQYIEILAGLRSGYLVTNCQ
jgi:hypothetical protein